MENREIIVGRCDITALKFTDLICNEATRIRLNELVSSFQLLHSVEQISAKELRKYPFSLNLLEVAMRQQTFYEPTHSIYLKELLGYKQEGSYPLLQSFFDELNIKETIIEPMIVAEKSKIDISIVDKGYAIIIENKINDAKDQPMQICKYIDVLKHTQNIYVIYLKGRCRDNPSETSFPSVVRKQYEDKGRYFAITFKTEILDWLNKIDLSHYNNPYFCSAVYQYRDYLQYKYKRRIMDSKIKECIKKELSDNYSVNIHDSDSLLNGIEELLEKLNNSIDYLSEIKDDVRQDAFDKAVSYMSRQVFDDEFIFHEKDGSIIVNLKHCKKWFSLEACFCLVEDDKPYIGFRFNTKVKQTSDLIKSIFNEDAWGLNAGDEDYNWYLWKYTTYGSIVNEFLDAYKRIKAELEINSIEE